MNLEQTLLNLAFNLATSPDVWERLFASGCHNAFDVCQDALEAAEHGHITKDQALKVINVLLGGDRPGVEPMPRPARPPAPLYGGDLSSLIAHINALTN